MNTLKEQRIVQNCVLRNQSTVVEEMIRADLISLESIHHALQSKYKTLPSKVSLPYFIKVLGLHKPKKNDCKAILQSEFAF